MSPSATIEPKIKTAGQRPGRDPGAPAFVQRLLRGLAWLPVSALILVFTLEIAFTLAHVGEQEYMKIDPTLGFLHLEGKPVTFRAEGFSRSVINSQGFRDHEYALAKPPGVVRIAVLGDSKTEAFQVSAGATFPKVLERRLNQLAPGRYQVINFGMSGYSTGQEYLLYVERVAAYHPDITILAYHIGDSDENCTADGALASAPRPYFTLNGNGQLVIDRSLLDQWMKGERAKIYSAFDQLRRHSRLWGVFANLEMALNGDKTFQFVARKVGKPLSELNSRFLALLPPADFGAPSARPAVSSPTSILPPSMRQEEVIDQLRAAFALPPLPAGQTMPTNEAQVYLRSGIAKWQVTSAILRELNDACRRSGSSLVVAALPAPDNSILYFKEIRYLEEQAKAERFDFVNVHRAFPSLRPMEKSPLYFDFHFTPAGHELVAITIFDRLPLSEKAVESAKN